MPRDAKQSDESSTLPIPELNPLLNPLLGQNMGRWAEVYFTAPPEKREQAVLELLRKLQEESDAGHGENSLSAGTDRPALEPTASTPPQIDGPKSFQPTVASQSSSRPGDEVPPSRVRCSSCGRENPAGHRFCGMCGKPVTDAISITDLEIADMQIGDPEIADHRFDSSQFDNPRLETVYESQRKSRPNINQNRGYDDERPYSDSYSGNDLELFRYLPASRRSYAYLWIALMVVAVGAAYIGWHRMQVSRNAHAELQAPSAIATPPAGPEPVANPSTPGMSEMDLPDHGPVANQSAPNHEANQQPPQPANNVSNTANRPAEATRRSINRAPKPARTAVAANPQNDAAGGNGSEELATAQRYLNGTDGQSLNRAEAAKWLWRAVGKHNPDATMLLADLYLKGQGVGKNCDQARILLDAAARQGIKGAGDHLRHLPAFGCQ